MFGYVKPFQPYLRVCELDTYKSLYCGLCRQLGASFGPFSRLTLSYDVVFLALLFTGLSEEGPPYGRCRCKANPLKKKACCLENEGLRFSAGCAMIMAYYKAKDNLHDHGFKDRVLSALSYPFLTRARKKAARQYGEIDAIMAKAMAAQRRIEEEGCDSIDRAADPSGTFLRQVFEQVARTDGQRRILSRMGYLLGRWIYMMDAFDDLESDLKRGNYNPLIGRYGLRGGEDYNRAAIGQDIVEMLNFTISEFSAGYQLLELYHYKPILDNIVILGFKNTQANVFTKYKGDA